MKPGQPFVDLHALAATDKESLTVQTKGKREVSRIRVEATYLNTIATLEKQAKEESRKK